MTLRRIALLTIWSVALFLFAVAASLRASAAGPNPLLNADVAASYDVKISARPVAPTPVPVAPTPEPTLIVDPTPVVAPTWIEIPDDLISTPTPEVDETVPLPMLTSISSAPRDGGVVYLTFDDGPDPHYTSQILDILARYGAHGTFFMLGDSVDKHPAVARRIVNEGHAIGNHTYYHEALPRESDENIIQTLAATNNAFARATGRTSSCLRPPYGSLDERSFQIVQNQGYQVTMWEVDSNDWKLSDPYSIAAGVLRDTNLGDRVLFHDGPANRAATVVALESVLSVLSERGVTFAALPC